MTTPTVIPTVPPAATRHVFVYGTLRRGGSNDITRLAPAPRFVGRAQLAGQMYDLGAYPGLILGKGDGQPEEGAPVHGEVYAIGPALEVLLDEIEEVFPQATGEYAKRELDVLVDGVAVRCIVYEINPVRTAGKPVIAGGDWLQRL